MSSIPEARRLIGEVAEAIATAEPILARTLERAIRLMTREPQAKPRAKWKYRCSPEKAEAIRAYLRANPDAQTIDVAKMFGVGTGRVSEAINGKR